MIELTIAPGTPEEPFEKFWQALGCDHLYEDTRSGAADRLFARISETKAIRYLRNHYALSDEMLPLPTPPGESPGEPLSMGGGIYHEDERGAPVYDFSIMDSVYDRWVACGIRPIVEMDRVPDLLRSDSGPVPINDFERWTGLISAFTEHLLERYGEEEVLTWYFECYNEPDRMPGWVHNLLYDHFAAAVTRVQPQLRIGGPAMFTPAIGPFLEHLGRGVDGVSGGSPRADFISYHRYAMTADEGDNFPLVFPYVADVVRCVQEYWGYARTFPSILETPFHLNEWGLIGRYAWGASRFAPMRLRDTEYSALFLAKLVTGLVALEGYRPEIGPARGKTPDLILYWGFAYEASRGTFLGNRSVLTGGPVLKPIWGAFELLAMLGERRLTVQGLGPGDPLSGLATRTDGGALQLLLYNFEEGPSDEDEARAGEHSGEGVEPLLYRAGSPRRLRLTLPGMKADRAGVRWLLLDREHGNSWAAWEAIGRPAQPDAAQVAQLQAAERPHEMSGGVDAAVGPNGTVLELTLPAQSLSVLTIGASP